MMFPPLIMLLMHIAHFANLAAHAETGIASIYTDRNTASGELFNSHALTAAHRTLPLGTWVKVTNKHNGRMVMVRINDRGPFVDGRIIDLTPLGAFALGFSQLEGLVHVAVDVIAPPLPKAQSVATAHKHVRRRHKHRRHSRKLR